jgi:hypothetical protein
MATVAVYSDVDCKDNFSHLFFLWHYFYPAAIIPVISYKNDKVSSLSRTDVCGLTAGVRGKWVG